MEGTNEEKSLEETTLGTLMVQTRGNPWIRQHHEHRW